MRYPRSAGLLLAISSLPNRFGIGDLGDGALAFVDFLQRAGQRIWQVLPLGPPAEGNSPYSSLSAFAGNPLLISPDSLVQQGLLCEADVPSPSPIQQAVDYLAVASDKQRMLEKSFQHMKRQGTPSHRQAAAQFHDRNRWWLDDFCLFTALRAEFQLPSWRDWPTELVQRRTTAIDHWRKQLNERIELECYVQYLFFQQWHQLKAYANARNVRIFGDMPLFVAYDSADVWVHQDLFCLDQQGAPTVVAGVPPDCFSATGQNWGNPLFDWDRLAAANYAWWVQRIEFALSCFDLLRIDHFRGLESYWEIPAEAPTAARGRWVKGPGAAPLQAAQQQLGELPLVAEDLGMITAAVHELRDELGIPGMRVLQFGFDRAEDTFHRPDRFPPHCVAYTGTHDNDTLVGWFHQLSDEQGRLVAPYLQGKDDVHWELIGETIASAADTAIIPWQDVLGLDGNARMNTPGQPRGNWAWRAAADCFDQDVADRLAHLVLQTERRG